MSKKFTISFTPEAMKNVTSLMRKTDIADIAKLVQKSFSIYDAVVTHVLNGGEVHLYNKDKDTLRLVVIEESNVIPITKKLT